MPHRKVGSSFTALVLEIFRFHRRLLAAGDRLTKPLHLSSARWQVLGGTLHTTSPGQEFVLDADQYPEVKDWGKKANRVKF
jgi:hypothetical protein